MKDLSLTDRDTKQATLVRSPELQKRLDEFHRNIGRAFCENLNRGVLAQSERELTLIAKQPAPKKQQTLEEAIQQPGKEMEDSVRFQFTGTGESYLPTTLKIVSCD